MNELTGPKINVLIKKHGIFWDKFRKPGDMDAVICPYDEKACSAQCPQVHIEDGGYICFTCSGCSVQYHANIEWENYQTEGKEDDKKNVIVDFLNAETIKGREPLVASHALNLFCDDNSGGCDECPLSKKEWRLPAPNGTHTACARIFLGYVADEFRRDSFL
jgi:hypothetical protein